MENLVDFGELATDESLKTKIFNLTKDLNSAAIILDKFFNAINYDELSLEDKVRYDLFAAFAINTFYWIYLRIKGIDPNSHEIKNQINRVRHYMSQSKKIYEKRTIMPRIDKGAAKRFIKNGLWHFPASTNSLEDQPDSSDLYEDKCLSKKRKREGPD